MALKFRRGTTAQKSGSLAFGEPYVNTSLQTLQIGLDGGDVTLSAITTGSNLVVASVSGEILATNGVVSGSSQLTTDFDARYLNTSGDSIVSGSSQVTLQSTTGFSSFDTALSTISGSLITSASAAKTTNDSQGVSITNINLTTASLNTSVTNLNTTTASLNTSVTNLNTYTSSLKTALSLSGADLTVLGNLTVQGDTTTLNTANLLVEDKLIELAIGTTTSAGANGAGIYISGANASILWDDANSTLDINKAIDITGNITLTGNVDGVDVSVFNSNVNSTTASLNTSVSNLNTFSGSANTRFTEIGVVSGSLITSASAAKTTNDSQGVSITNLNSATASLNTSVSNLNTFSGSALTRLDNLEGKDFSITLTGDVTGTGTVTNLSNVSFATTVAANSVALGTDTTGDYVATMTAGAGITVGTATGEGSTPVITNTGVTSNVAGTGVSVSGATGAVTISIGQTVATSSSPTFAGLTINGAITATGDITAYYTSDKRHKNNIQTISNAVLKVKQLNGVTWEWNDDVNEVTKTTPKTGLIAQEVQQVLPQVVIERADGFLALDYSKMVGLLVEAIKEQQIQIDQLKAQIGSK